MALGVGSGFGSWEWLWEFGFGLWEVRDGFVGNHPKQAGLTWPKKKKSQEIILAISCSNKATSV